MRISKPHSSSSGQGADTIKQRSIQSFFDSTNIRMSVGQSSIVNTETNRGSATSPNSTMCATSAAAFFLPQQKSSSPPSTSNSSATSQSEYPPHLPARGRSAQPTQSSYFTDSNSAGASGVSIGQRKRPHDDHSSFDLAASMKSKPPALQQRTASTSSSTSTASLPSSAAPHGVASSSSSSSALTVKCPVCQAKVQESKINEHLDSCLS